MEPSDLSNGSKILNDVLCRRVKNRERQRRYRERKRLNAGSRNANVKASQMQMVPLLTNGTVEQYVTRVHCKRDWKKDARRAHAAKPEAISNAMPSSIQYLTSENHITNVALGTRQTEQIMNGEVLSQSYTCKSDGGQITTKRGRRDWKAEARNKK